MRDPLSFLRSFCARLAAFLQQGKDNGRSGDSRDASTAAGTDSSQGSAASSGSSADAFDDGRSVGMRHRIGPRYLPVSLSSVFIRHPVATTLLTIALALSGAVAFQLLPVAPLPEMDFPVVFVRANMPGAGPETMAATVATPLERAMGRIAGITEMTSTSSLGKCNVILQFDLSRDVNGAARDVQAAINAARANLPSNMPSNPTYRKINPSGAPILIIALTSDTVSNYQMYDMAQNVLAQKIAQIPGVGEVSLGGGALPAIRIDVIPEALYRNGLSLQDISGVLKSANVFMPRGSVSNEEHFWFVGVNDQLSTPEEYKNIIVASRNGQTVRLGDIARVSEGAQDVRSLALANGKTAILLMVFKATGANVIETVDRIKAIIPSMRKWVSGNVELSIGNDRSITIRSSLKEVEKSLLISMALVILVVFLFLRNVRATSIPAVAAPVSLIGTFVVMYLAGHSLDNLSLMALTIATGFVVDDAIVVLENIVRRLELGETPLRAALTGSREVGFTIISMSVSLVAVFIPILCFPGILGSVFREFAVVLSVAILISMAVSLTTTPMMCAAILTHEDGRKASSGRLAQMCTAAGEKWGRILDSLRDAYARSLTTVLRHRRITLGVFFLVIVANVWLYIVIPKGFFPEQDTGMLMGGIRLDQSLSFQASCQKLRRIQDILMQDPAIEKVNSHISGGRGSSGMFITLKPLGERKVSAQRVIARLRPKLMSEPGAMVFLQAAQDLHFGGRSGRSQYQYTLQADNTQELRHWGRLLTEELKKSPIVVDVDNDLEERGLETFVTVSRDRMTELGISMSDVDTALGLAFGQSQVSTIYQDKSQYKVVLEFDTPWLQSPEALKEIRFPGKDGLVPFESIASIDTTFSALSVAHQGQFAAVTVSFNLPKGKALSDAQKAIADACSRIGMPSHVFGSFQGSAKLFAETIRTETILILAALVTLYIVLGVLYESLIHPLTILSTLPPAGGGALIALLMFGMEFSVIALIGVLLLCGLVKKNAILMVDFALTAERRDHLSPEAAIFEACRLRFRPILMTTFAAMLGAVPLALGTGDGAELRQPLGVAIVGGLAVSQVLTLYTTPVIFLALDSLRRRFRLRRLTKRYGTRKARLLLALSSK